MVIIIMVNNTQRHPELATHPNLVLLLPGITSSEDWTIFKTKQKNIEITIKFNNINVIQIISTAFF